MEFYLNFSNIRLGISCVVKSQYKYFSKLCANQKETNGFSLEF
jgi:hypothetical protein